MSDLKPCAHCDGKPKRTSQSGDERDGYMQRVTISCCDCGSSVSASGDTSKGGYADNSTVDIRAAEKWNRRTQPEATAPEKSEYRKGYEQANTDYCKMIDTNCHYRERVFNEILKADSAEGMNRFTRTAPAQDLSAAIPDGWQLVPKTRDVAPNVFDKMILGAMKAFADPGYSPSKWDGNHGALVRYIIEGAARHQEHWPESIPAAALASSANALSAGDRVDALEQVHKFLMGEAPLDGYWFSENSMEVQGIYWWRTKLRAAILQSQNKT